ncbi:MAG: RuBisCO large subunit C-terminal-like domain-containing protein, partial [Candidatus Bathyarchaeia archaeon]
AKIVNINPTSENSGIIQLAVNAENYDPEFGGLENLLSDIAGNIYDMKILDNTKLLDLVFPKYWAKSFPGPKFGIEGLRKLLALEKDRRPLIGNITKPNLGLDAKTYAQQAYEVALGGIDFVKDDEALVDPKYCRLMDRITAVMEALDKARGETGKKVFYAVNITARPNKMLEIADKVIEAGANHLMVCLAYVGYGGLRALAEDPSINVPIHVHRCGHGSYTRNPKHGLGASLMSKLARMCGADELHTGSIAGKFIYDALDVRQNVTAMTGKLYDFKQTLPVSSAGNHPGNMRANIEVMGTDILFLAGGGILGHPDGPTAGAKAMMKAVEAAMKNIPIKEAVKESQELKRAIEKWGYIERW